MTANKALWTPETAPPPPGRKGSPNKLTAIGRDIISDTISPEMRAEMLQRLFTIAMHSENQSVPALALLMSYCFGKPRQTIEIESVDLGAVITQEMREALFNRLLDKVKARDAEENIINVEAKVIDSKKNSRRNGPAKKKAKAKRTRNKLPRNA